MLVLILSLTRNVSYFIDEIPNDCLATSTTFVQCTIRRWINDIRKPADENQKDDKKKKLIEMIKNNKDEIKKLIKTITKEDEYQEDGTQEDEKDRTRKHEIA